MDLALNNLQRFIKPKKTNNQPFSSIKNVSRVKRSISGKGIEPSLIPCVVAIEKGAFGLLFTKISKLTYFLCRINIWGLK